MLLTSARIKTFKSIEDSGQVPLDSHVTVLVGQNESGKTAFLQALHKAESISDEAAYDVIEDYPRKSLNEYERQHARNPATVVELTYQLQNSEIEEINSQLGVELSEKFSFTVNHLYNNTTTITITVPENPYVEQVLSGATLTSEIKAKASQATTVRELLTTLESSDLNTEETSFFEELKTKFGTVMDSWHNMVVAHHVYFNYLKKRTPKFLYFDDYYLLPGKINLPSLQERVNDSKENKKPLADKDKTVMSLLRMANVQLADLTGATGYEKGKAKLEGISNSITDQIFKYWTQNPNLDVEFDIRPDPKDQAPYDEGNNLYIRIRNRRHRVTVPFSQRSKGFIWFFSFIVWFDSIKQQLGTKDELILLLDEPGLSLHALAQADLLRYIDTLADEHQVVYTSHSPFMIHSDRLHQVRTVQDVEKGGTKVSANVSASDPATIFPLQAALGYTLAQNLFISKRNLLVEGPADLIYLRFFSSLLEQSGRAYLREDVTVVPVGGLDKLATFVALLRGNELELVVVHDYANRPDPHLESLVREKIIREKQVLNYAMFRDATAAGGTSSAPATLQSTDVEDLISVDLYLNLFNGAYKTQLAGKEIKESDLPPGNRIVDRIEKYLAASSIKLRPSGGYNHYLVASYMASNPPTSVDADTLNRFDNLFKTVNGLYTND
jgi:predicted ATP-dependent endonuclease of OLD family